MWLGLPSQWASLGVFVSTRALPGGIEVFVCYLPFVMHVDSPPQDSASVLFGRADIPIRRINVESGILRQTNKL